MTTATFNFDATSTGAATASVTAVLTATLQSAGHYLITGITGTVSGSTITTLDATNSFYYSTTNYGDNLLSYPTTPYFDGDGIVFTAANGLKYNFYASSLETESASDTQTSDSDIQTGSATYSIDLACFVSGTRLATPAGEVAVEDLAVGNLVLTLDTAAGGPLSGHEPHGRPIKWIGRRRIVLPAHPRPETVTPIRIQRNAFAESSPHRDLMVSPDHALFVDGKLISARQLVNGTTIRQEQGLGMVDYFHVELDTHSILLAEGLPAESYLDTGNRSSFTNSEGLVAHPALNDAPCCTRETGSCAPFVWAEDNVRPVWRRLAGRAAALGQPRQQTETTSAPDLQIVSKGRTLQPTHTEQGHCIFRLPKDTTEVRLVSRACRPTDVRPWLEDRRVLGVQVVRIVIRNSDNVHDVPIDHPALDNGWWAVERDGGTLRRWTNGDATLPLPSLGSEALLEIHLGTAMLYKADARPGARLRAA
jgi:Hint domain